MVEGRDGNILGVAYANLPPNLSLKFDSPSNFSVGYKLPPSLDPTAPPPKPIWCYEPRMEKGTEAVGAHH